MPFAARSAEGRSEGGRSAGALFTRTCCHPAGVAGQHDSRPLDRLPRDILTSDRTPECRECRVCWGGWMATAKRLERGQRARRGVGRLKSPVRRGVWRGGLLERRLESPGVARRRPHAGVAGLPAKREGRGWRRGCVEFVGVLGWRQRRGASRLKPLLLRGGAVQRSLERRLESPGRYGVPGARLLPRGCRALAGAADPLGFG